MVEFQELSLRMERLTDESKQKKHVLEHETTETLTAQIELDKTAEDFRKAHQERQNLIEQWEHTIEQMQRRDKEMDLLAAVSLFLIFLYNMLDTCKCMNINLRTKFCIFILHPLMILCSEISTSESRSKKERRKYKRKTAVLRQ